MYKKYFVIMRYSGELYHKVVKAKTGREALELAEKELNIISELVSIRPYQGEQEISKIDRERL